MLKRIYFFPQKRKVMHFDLSEKREYLHVSKGGLLYRKKINFGRNYSVGTVSSELPILEYGFCIDKL